MGAIDIGGGAVSGGTQTNTDYTDISLDNPANAAGLLTSFEVDVMGASGPQYSPHFYWGTFYGSSTNYTSRGVSSDLGYILAGSKQTFTGQNVICGSGDFIGTYTMMTTGTYSICMNPTGGLGVYYKTGNQFGTGSQSYSNASYTTRTLSVYATGITAPDAPSSVSATDNLYDKVTITWTAGAGETDGHRVYRDGTDISGVVAHGTATFNDTTAVPGITYAYTVKAINITGLSAASSADNGMRLPASFLVMFD